MNVRIGDIEVDVCFTRIISVIQNAVDYIAPEKCIVIERKHIIRESWMRKGFI